MSFILRTLLTCELSMHISETQILNKSTLHEYRLLLQPSREHHHTYQNNGYTLRELNLGHKYGVHVASIIRGMHRINIPGANVRLFPGDTIQVSQNPKDVSRGTTNVLHTQDASDL